MPKTAALLSAKRQPTKAEMTQDLSPPSELGASAVMTGAVRKPAEANFSLEFSPKQVMNALRSAQSGTNLQEYVRIANLVLRRSAKLRSVFSQRVLAITGLPRVVEPGGTKLKDKKAAEACQELVNTPTFKSLLRHLAWADYYGWAGAQIIYGEGSLQWPVQAVKPLKTEWFMFDPADGETPLLVPKESGQAPQYLDVFGKYVFHTPTLLPGSPWLNGIAYTAVFYAALTHVVLKQGTQFVELFAMPMRVGKYPLGESETHLKNRAALRQALENLGSDAWAMIPEDMQLEFLKDATVTGSVEVYERWSRYFDELLAGLIQGGNLNSGTSNTSSGNGQAAATVHREGFYDLVRASADDMADTVTRDVFTPFVQFNFGPDVAVPRFRMPVEEAEDVSAWVDSTDKAMRNGLRVPAEEFYKRLNIRAPSADEEVLGGTPAAAAGTEGLTVKLSADNSNADELDALIAELQAEEGYALAEAQADEALLAAIEQATDAETLKKALMEAVRTGKVDGLQAVFTAGATAARVAGDVGVIVGGK